MDVSGDLDGHDQLVVCVNSILRISEKRQYSVIIMDEADFIQRHFVSGTFSRSTTLRRRDSEQAYTSDAVSCLKRLSALLTRATAVVAMQEGLDDEDLSFYEDAMIAGTRLLSARPRVVAKKFFLKRTRNERYQMTTELGLWLAAIKEKILRGKKVFITCSQRGMADFLRTFIIDKCRPAAYPDANTWQKKVALITGTTILPSGTGMKKGEDFVLHFREFDVSVVTSTLESGVSLSRHYELVFCFCSRMPITFPCQVQLPHRVRDCEAILIYAEKRIVFRFFQDKKSLVELFSAPANCAYEQLLASTVGVLLSEEADTFNNNHILWLENRKPQDVSTEGVVDVMEGNHGTDQWFGGELEVAHAKSEALKQFWNRARARSLGIFQYIRLVANDVDLIRMVEQMEHTIPMAYTIAVTSKQNRSDVAALLGERAYLFFSLHSRRCQFTMDDPSRAGLEDFKRSWFTTRTLPITLLYFVRVDHWLEVHWDGVTPLETQWGTLKCTAEARGHHNLKDLSLLGMVHVVDSVVSWITAIFGTSLPKPGSKATPDKRVMAIVLRDMARHQKNPYKNQLVQYKVTKKNWFRMLTNMVRKFSRLPFSASKQGEKVINAYPLYSIALRSLVQPPCLWVSSKPSRIQPSGRRLKCWKRQEIV